MSLTKEQANELQNSIEGKVFTDKSHRTIYSTDASAYSEKPMAVVVPKTNKDIEQILQFANRHNIPLIPRATGTSLAGQVVGKGLVVDTSKHFTKILELNEDEKWVKVQCGVILDELNRFLAPRKLFFGPEASTANRCTIGGMVGNNACGLHAVVYKTTRNHLLEVSGYLSNGEPATFKALNKEDFLQKCEQNNLEGKIYKHLHKTLSDKDNQQEIIRNYPDKELIRRNTGYALDLLLYNNIFGYSDEPINLSNLIAGSEGTLMFITHLKLNLVDIPPKNKTLTCVHFSTIDEALRANIVALKHKVTAVELMDDNILIAAKRNIEQRKNSFFVKGEPKAVLLIEMVNADADTLHQETENLIKDLKDNNLGYHYPVLYNEDTKIAWTLRKAGLGILSNTKSDKKAVSVIEDTAVMPDVLPEYIAEFTKIMDTYNEACVYHAHAGTGELHLRPKLNLKDPKDVDKFEQIATDIAHLVKKYNGSLSGEHGDGRLRGQFIPLMMGDKVYALLKELKHTWDEKNILNPGKITDTPPMRGNLRYKQAKQELKTYFDFSAKGGFARAIESCNGSGDCRKLHTANGTMCPSYQATLNESQTTRARANLLREFLLNSNTDTPFKNKELYQILDLCLSCKACKSECPSSIDMAKLKAEFLQHYYKHNRIPIRTLIFANITKMSKLGALIPIVTNTFLNFKPSAFLFKSAFRIAPQRSFPKILHRNFTKFAQKQNSKNTRKVYLFVDEFTKYNDIHLGEIAIKLLQHLGYKVEVIENVESGRAYLSKGLVKHAKKLANKNVNSLFSIISEQTPLLGIEPSALLTFRDEYSELVDSDLQEKATELSKHCLLIEEFLQKEIEQGRITKEMFTKKPKKIKLHGHCQLKAIASTKAIKTVLSLPENYEIEEIKSGCCGMAGSFGYEKEHYDLSMKIGELVLFPEVRKTDKNTTITAPGTSCRHQIFDGTQRKALHPIELLWEACVL